MSQALFKKLLGALPVAAAFACGAAQAEPTVVAPVKGYTFAGDKLVSFEALAFDKGRVLGVGEAASLAKQYPDARKIDGQGRTLLPGLIDAHGHVFRIGFRQSEVVVTDTRTLAEAQAKIKAYGQANPARQWIMGSGWNQVIWKLDRFPTAAELDAAIPDRPVTLRRVDAHAIWANTKALQMAGITRDTPDPVGGRIERDAKGEPTGILIDKAQLLLTKVMPPYTDAERRIALDSAMRHFASLGLTGVGDAGTGADEVRIYREFADTPASSPRGSTP